MTQTNARQELGARGEDLAATTLREAGMIIITRNWRCRWGEIDIVARDWSGGRSTLVFCEVKTRSGKGYGTPAESITWQKQKKLRRLAAEFMRIEGSRADAIRIDVIGIVLAPDQPPQVNHVRSVAS